MGPIIPITILFLASLVGLVFAVGTWNPVAVVMLFLMVFAEYALVRLTGKVR